MKVFTNTIDNGILLELNKKDNEHFVSIEQVEAIKKKGLIPEFYTGVVNKDLSDKPCIAMPLQIINDSYYRVSESCVKFFNDVGVNLKLFDPARAELYFDNVDGLCLQGGRIAYPFDYDENSKGKPSEYLQEKVRVRSGMSDTLYGYVKAFNIAKKKGLPMLGICAGAQIIANMYDVRMFHIARNNLSQINHLDRNLYNFDVHKLDIGKNNPLWAIYLKNMIAINSIHQQGVKGEDFEASALDIWAKALEEMGESKLPEAWGSEKDNVFCVQWHPEIMYAMGGDLSSLEIARWLRDKAALYKYQKDRKQERGVKNIFKDYCR